MTGLIEIRDTGKLAGLHELVLATFTFPLANIQDGVGVWSLKNHFKHDLHQIQASKVHQRSASIEIKRSGSPCYVLYRVFDNE